MTQHVTVPQNGLSLLLVLAVALAACASGTSARGEAIRIADESQVKGCTSLKDVSRKVGWWYGVLGEISGIYAQEGLENARSEVLRQAKEQGATHVVWLPRAEGSESPKASAKVYRCGTQNRSR
jgi:hypothetical protein